MKLTAICLLTTILTLGLLVSCSKSDPVSLDNPGSEMAPESNTLQEGPDSPLNNRYLWGYYEIGYDPVNNEAEVTPVRELGSHFNVLKFLEDGPCTDCVAVNGITPQGDGVFDFDIEITHPFTNLKFSGFDVRAHVIFNGTHEFPESGYIISNELEGEGTLLHLSGMSPLYSMGTEPYGPFKGYYKGELATPQIPSATLNPYVTYSSYMTNGNPRNIFVAGHTIERTLKIQFPTDQFVFGYAVDASWSTPSVNPVSDPETDFPPAANISEPYYILNQADYDNLSNLGGYAHLITAVSDYGGYVTHYEPKVECPELFNGSKEMAFDNANGDTSYWSLDISNEKQADPGEYTILVTVEDKENQNSPGHIDLTSCVKNIVEVYQNEGFARTWGGAGNDSAFGIVVDDIGNIYIAGHLGEDAGGVDFDPGPDEDIHYSEGMNDIFLTSYDKLGNFRWARTIGGVGNDGVTDMEIDSEGLLYISGFFSETVDFDPYGGTEFRISNGGTDAFFGQYSDMGHVLVLKKWGGPADDSANAIHVNSFYIHVAGHYSGTVNFDTDGGNESHTSSGGLDAYASQFLISGEYVETHAFGGTEACVANGITAISGDVMVTGTFAGTVNFDPEGPGHIHTSAGFQDSYILPLDGMSYGYPAKVLSSAEPVVIWAIDSLGSFAYVVGSFGGTVDFNYPGTPMPYASNGLQDCFVTAIDSIGSEFWTRTWGGPGDDLALDVVVDDSGDLYVGGSFNETVNFDPSGGTNEWTSNGFADAYVSKFNIDSSYDWTNAFGSDLFADQVYDLSIGDDYIITTGTFTGDVVFDPEGGDPASSVGGFDVFINKYLWDGTW